MKKECENSKVKELQCEVVQDLLPLYHDDVVNDVTKQAVKIHLDGCEKCTQEYEALCEELPQEKSDGYITKSKFDAMKNCLKKKQRIKTIIIALVSCMLVVLLGHVLLYVPIVPIEDGDAMRIQSAYKVENNGKTILFFVLEEQKMYKNPMQWQMQIEKNGKEAVLRANMKRTVFTSVYKEIRTMSHDWMEIDSDIEKISFAGEIIWSKEENGKEEIPEYVKELVRLDDSEEEYSVVTDEEGITIQYDEQEKYLTSDFAGNILCEGYYEDAPSKYFEGTVLGKEDEYMIIQPFAKYWITDISDTIYVPMNTEEGQTTKDFRNVKVGDRIGVYFAGDLPKEPDYVVDKVTKIEINPADE